MFRELPRRMYRKFISWRFSHLESQIHETTISTHDSVIEWAKTFLSRPRSSNEHKLAESGEIVETGRALRKEVMAKFKNYHSNLNQLRILIHLPDRDFSPAGNFLFENLRQSLNFLGIATAILDWKDKDLVVLESFRPTIFLTSDHSTYLSRIDWDKLAQYKLKYGMKLGLTASLAEYGNTELAGRLQHAKAKGVDFFYSFRTPEYLKQRREYLPFYDSGYEILSVEFGANILLYYPEPEIQTDLDYIFFGSINPDKSVRYIRYFSKIFKGYPGYIDGVGWAKLNKKAEAEIQRYIYARARLGINLHLTEQLRWPSELNERTYVLAACGVPQILDNPALLASRFSPEAFFVARSPREYFRLFQEALNNPAERERRSLIALKEVYTRHTTLHRASQFAEALLNHL